MENGHITETQEYDKIHKTDIDHYFLKFANLLRNEIYTSKITL